MKDGKTSNDLEKFLDKLGGQYMPDNPEAKTGIGHDVEHVKGVMNRSDEIADIINTHPDKYHDAAIDKNISTTIAALHDIGNTITRSDHALMGAGVVKGSITVEDVLSVPSKIKAGLSEENVKNILSADKGETEFNALNQQERSAYIEATIEVIRFEYGYNGVDIHDMNADSEIMSHALSYIASRPDLMKDISYNDSLQEITSDLHELFTDDELNIIAEAIQDHNIDHDGQGRYDSRSIYGEIIADADKDNIIETFMIRTLAFSINKCPNIYDAFVSKTGNVDMTTCIQNVYAQTWIRFHPIPNVDDPNSQIVPSIVIEIYGLDNINGVLTDDYAREYVSDHPDSVLQEYQDRVYCIQLEKGDDTYSQIDNKFEPDKEIGTILGLRSDFIEDAERLALSAVYRDIGLPEYLKPENIATVYELAPSIESAVALVESIRWGFEPQDWESIVKHCLDGEVHEHLENGMDRDEPDAYNKIRVTILDWYINNYIDWDNPTNRIDQIIDDIQEFSVRMNIPEDQLPLDKLNACRNGELDALGDDEEDMSEDDLDENGNVDNNGFND